MSLENDAAPAASEPAPAPAQQIEAPATEQIDRSTEITPRQSIERAMAAMEAKESDAPVVLDAEAIEPNPNDGTRDPVTGRFLPKATTDTAAPAEAKPDADKKLEAVTYAEPPARFSAAAKEAWKAAPPAVQEDVHRAISEMEKGIEKHREGAQKWAEIGEYEQLAQQHNVTVKDMMARYVAADMALGRDLVSGLDAIAQQHGASLRQIAEHVLKQAPDQAAAGTERTIRDLRAQVQRLEQQVGGVTTTITEQKQLATQREIEQFATANPRFDELSGEIARLLQTGFAKDLPDAYAKAERLNPAPAQAPAPGQPAPSAQANQSEQIAKGKLSTAGAPSSGSNPVTRKPPSSPREALERAFAQTGA